MSDNNRILADRPMPRARQTHDDRKPGRRVTVNLAESPLGWLYARKLVSQRQFEAGEMLRRDYDRAALAPRITMSWDVSRIGSGRVLGNNGVPDATDAQLSAKRRFHAAIGHAGAGLADILWRVVCAGEALPVAEKGLGWPARSGRLVLTLALDRIADYHRLPKGSARDGRTPADHQDCDRRNGDRAAGARTTG